MNFGETPGKKGPEEGEIKNESSVYQKAYRDREVAVMGRNCGYPVDQDCVECNTSQKSEHKGLFRSLFVQSEKKRDEGDPTQKGEIEFRESQCRQCTAEDRRKDIDPSYLQEVPLFKVRSIIDIRLVLYLIIR